MLPSLFIRDTSAGRIDNYVDEQVLYLSEQREENCAEVRTKLSGCKVDTILDFRLVDKVGHWYVYDRAIVLHSQSGSEPMALDD